MLAPTLQRQDIVMPNNLTSHKIAGLAEAIDAHGAQLVYLPTLQPRPQPNRAGLRQIRGGAAQGRRAPRDGLWQLIGQTPDRFHPQEFRNFFKKTGGDKCRVWRELLGLPYAPG
jgi:transposase